MGNKGQALFHRNDHLRMVRNRKDFLAWQENIFLVELILQTLVLSSERDFIVHCVCAFWLSLQKLVWVHYHLWAYPWEDIGGHAFLRTAQLVLVLGPRVLLESEHWQAFADWECSLFGNAVFQNLRRLLIYLFLTVPSANNYSQRLCLGNF